MTTENEDDNVAQKPLMKWQESCDHNCAQSMIPSNEWVAGFPRSITVECTICEVKKVYVPEVQDAGVV